MVYVFAAKEFVLITFVVVPAATCPPVTVMLPEPFGVTGFVPGAVKASTVKLSDTDEDTKDTNPLASTVK